MLGDAVTTPSVRHVPRAPPPARREPDPAVPERPRVRRRTSTTSASTSSGAASTTPRGWEMIASPEMFLAAAGQVTHTIKLGTGVVSLPYHHPFNVAQRIVQLDHMTKGRAMFGSGPGALPSDARTMGISPDGAARSPGRGDGRDHPPARAARSGSATRASGSRFTTRPCRSCRSRSACRWPPRRASAPAACRLAGKYGIGVLSIASNNREGLQALPTQWGFAEEAARVHGTTVDRRELAGADELAHRRDQGAGPPRSRRRLAPLAQRVQRAASSVGRGRPTSTIHGTCSTRSPRVGPKAAARR